MTKNIILLMCLWALPAMADNSLPYLTRPLDGEKLSTRSFSEKVFNRKSKLQNNPQIKSLQFSELELDQLNLWDQSSFIMALEDGIEVKVNVDKKYWDDNGRIHVTGKIAGDYYGKAHIVATQKGMSANITAGGKEYNLMPLGEGLHSTHYYEESIQQQRNHSRDIELLRLQILHEKKLNKNRNNSGTLKALSTEDNFIDVLIVYTDDVAAASADPEATNASHIDYTNQALIDSCANYRMRVVAQEQVTYTEGASAVADLNCVTQPGHADCAGNDLSSVPTWRSANGADLVQFVTYTSDYCGLAWVGSEPFNAAYGYSNKLFLCGGSTMAHEFGHNLGLGHDRYETGNGPRDTSPYGKGHGYIDLDNNTRTIMSYSNQCTDLGESCTRIGIFSNPSIIKNGKKQGDYGFTDATSRMNETFEAVSEFNNPATSYSVAVNESCVSSSDSDKDVHCFVATAAYGSYLHKHVVQLKSFRDNFLKKFSLGRKFIDIYYKYSPRVAFYIAKNPWLKTASRWALTPFVLVITYPIHSLLILGLFVFAFFMFRRNKTQLLILPLLLFIPWDFSEAQVAQPSLFEHQIPTNPAAVYSPLKQSYLGASANVYSADDNSGNEKVEVSGTPTQIHGGVVWDTGALIVQNQPEAELEYKITNGTNSPTTDYLKNEYTHVGLSIAMFEQTHLGFKYKQGKETLEKYATPDNLITDTEQVNIGTGLVMKFGEIFYLGASVDHVSEKGTALADTKWVETSLGFGLTQRVENDAWLFELSATRSPEVSNTKYGNTTQHPENLEMGLFLEREMPMADSMFNSMTIGGFYKTSADKAMDAVLTEDQKTTLLGVNLGIKTFNRTLDATVSYTQVKRDYSDLSDTIIGLTLMYKFSGSIFSLAGATQ